ncbi:hypothetical protein TanjilG_05595 [Lupinus angustifolius]|uniref:WAT1-related protein n=1 Tax=Lupinus angustifolius TaxID=3871 RepID=A0A4P1QSL0_LUPAN|nr:PREDICTED: WAT1-related protein At4g15540-like [Lupinus angustifolius]OIV93892.1 hypothetical protein TanjilG_05595 [Lupinus angustifolius]
MAGWHFYNDVVPFVAIVAIECIVVGVNVLYKAATLKGLSYYVFIVYSFSVSSIVLLFPLSFVLIRSRGLPPFNASIFLKIFLLAVLGFVVQLCGAKGIKYTSPTLSSALSILVPAFTFILAVFFRMENLALRSKRTQAKIFGTILSILGALIVVLYKGRTILSDSNPLQSPATHSLVSSSSQTNWILGGSLLVAQYLLVPIMYIFQSSIMNQCPSEVIVVFTFCLCVTFISAPICFLLETNRSAWKITPDIRMVAILCWGILITCFSSLVYAWGLRLKGPVYISIFKPASIVIAATLSVIFLGEALYLGTVVGAVILSFGFYAVIWGKAKEEELSEEIGEGRTEYLPDSKTPLLEDSNVTDNSEIMYTNCP